MTTVTSTETQRPRRDPVEQAQKAQQAQQAQEAAAKKAAEQQVKPTQDPAQVEKKPADQQTVSDTRQAAVAEEQRLRDQQLDPKRVGDIKPGAEPRTGVDPSQARLQLVNGGDPAATVKQDDAQLKAARTGEVKPGEVKPGEVKPGEVKPGEVKPADVTTPEGAQKVADDYKAALEKQGLSDDDKQRITKDFQPKIEAAHKAVLEKGSIEQQNQFFNTLSQAAETGGKEVAKTLGESVAKTQLEAGKGQELRRLSANAIESGAGAQLTAGVADALAKRVNSTEGAEKVKAAMALNATSQGVRQAINTLKRDLDTDNAKLGEFQAARLKGMSAAESAGLQVDKGKVQADFEQRHSELVQKREETAAKLAKAMPVIPQLEATASTLTGNSSFVDPAGQQIQAAKNNLNAAKLDMFNAFPTLASTKVGAQALLNEANATGRPSILDGLSADKAGGPYDNARLGLAQAITDPKTINNPAVQQAITSLQQRGGVLPDAFLSSVKDIAGTGATSKGISDALQRLGGGKLTGAMASKLKGLAGGLALAVAADRGLPADQVAKAAADLFAGSAEAASIAARQLLKSDKFVGIMKDALKQGTSGLKSFGAAASTGAKWAGVLGTAFGGIDAYRQFANGDTTKGVAGLTSTVAGLGALALGSNPAGWTAAAIAGAASLAPMAIDAYRASVRNQDETKAVLQQAGVDGPGLDALSGSLGRSVMPQLKKLAEAQGMSSKDYLNFLAGQPPSAVKGFLQEVQKADYARRRARNEEVARARLYNQQPPAERAPDYARELHFQQMYLGKRAA